VEWHTYACDGRPTLARKLDQLTATATNYILINLAERSLTQQVVSNTCCEYRLHAVMDTNYFKTSLTKVVNYCVKSSYNY